METNNNAERIHGGMTPENLQPPEIMIEDNQTPEELEDPPLILPRTLKVRQPHPNHDETMIPQFDFKPPETPRPLISTDLFAALIRRHNLAVNDLTETQLAEAIRQAMPDFRRHVHVTGQAVVYIPGMEADRWKTLYHELLWSVESVHEGETRHETALRYIRERETHSCSPASDSSANDQGDGRRDGGPTSPPTSSPFHPPSC